MGKEEFLFSQLNKLGIDISHNQIKQFIRYYELLVDWNTFMNLTGITEFHAVVIKHFADSLSLVKAVDLEKKLSIIDIGTGAGFPGIPLKIVFPHLKITLLDSLQKRIKFLDTVINELGLDEIYPVHGRAEDYVRQDGLRENFDLCISRAVANLSVLSEYCIPFVKQDGSFISYKSERFSEELEQAKNAISILGGKLDRQINFTLDEGKICRNLIVIHKIKNTPIKYPRKSGIISKQPL